MNIVYFGSMNEYIEAGYAPTGRASCKGCKQKIEKESVRIGLCMNDDHFNGRYWYHLNCFDLKPRFKYIDPKQQIYNLENLEKEDCDKVLNYMNQEVVRVKQGKKKSKVKAAPGANKQKTKAQKKEESQNQASKDSSLKSDDEGQQQENQDPDFKLKKGSKKQKLKQKKSKAKSKSKDKPKSIYKSVSKSQVSDQPAKKKIKKIKSTTISTGYTVEQQKQFQELFDHYITLSADKLKLMLRLNSQPKTGNKTVLAQKCADGKILGKIPTCSCCGGGKLRFTRSTGIYKCPGYMDDDEFKNCSQSYTLDEVVRDKWAQP